MNLILRPLNDVNDATWSVIICLMILLLGVSYYIVMTLRLSFQELDEDE